MSWPVVRLEDIALSVRNGIFARRPTDTPGGSRILRISAVRDGRVNLDDAKWVTGLDPSQFDRFSLKEDDLLLTRYNGSRSLVGISGIVPTVDEATIHPDKLIRVVIDKTKADPRFVNHQLNSPLVRAHIEPRIRTTAGQSGISGTDVKSTPIVFPPLDEQRRIVDLLEDHLSRLDAASTELSKALRRADALVASSLAMHTTRAAESKKARSSTVGAEAVLIEYGTSAKCALLQDQSDVPVIRMGNLKDGELDWGNLKYLPVDHEQFPKLLLQPGDLLFNRTNSAELVGKAAVFDGASTASFASYLIRVRFKDSVDPGWANMVINSPVGRRYIVSVVSQQVGQANVNGTKLKAFPLPLPPRDEQERRVAEHRETLQMRQRLRVALDHMLTRSDSLRRSLLTAAFSGRLTRDRQHLDTEDLVSP